MTTLSEPYLMETMNKIIFEIETNNSLSLTAKITEVRIRDLSLKKDFIRKKDIKINEIVKYIMSADLVIVHYGLSFDLRVLINNIQDKKLQKEFILFIMNKNKIWDIATVEKNLYSQLTKRNGETEMKFKLRIMRERTNKAKFSMENIQDKYNLKGKSTLDTIEEVYNQQYKKENL